LIVPKGIDPIRIPFKLINKSALWNVISSMQNIYKFSRKE
jgi:hypothetical protein